MIRLLIVLMALVQGAGQDEKRLQEWIEKLGAESLDEREEAEAKLKEAGEKAVPSRLAAGPYSRFSKSARS